MSEKRLRQEGNTLDNNTPLVSVSLCTYRRPALLPRCLESLLCQSTSFAFELIVVDNDAQGSARPIVEGMQGAFERAGIRLRYLIEPELNLALARNRGLAACDGEYVAFIDDDETAGEDWLERLYSTLVAEQVDGVFGPVKIEFSDAFPEWMRESRAWRRLTDRPTGQRLARGGTGNVLVKRSLLLTRPGPFSGELGPVGGSDSELFDWLTRRGATLCWCNEAVACERQEDDRATWVSRLRCGYRLGWSRSRQCILRRGWLVGFPAAVGFELVSFARSVALAVTDIRNPRGAALYFLACMSHLLGTVGYFLRIRLLGYRVRQHGRRSGLAVISRLMTPYRMHLHSRIAEEIPEVSLHTIITGGAPDFVWKMNFPQEINVVDFEDTRSGRSRRSWMHIIENLRLAGRIIAYLREHNIQAVLFNFFCRPEMLRVFRYCRKNGIKTFIRSDANVRCKDNGTRILRWVRRLFERKVFRSADVLMPMGTLGQLYFEANGGSCDKCVRVPYEPDYDLFSSVDSSALAGFRLRHGMSADRRYLLFCGRLVNVKRVDLLIDAFVKIAEKRLGWDLLIVGDGQLRAELRSRIPDHLRDRIVWTGFCEMKDVRTAYHAAHVMVLPSEHERWALVVNEALAAGLPVVASNIVGAAYEMVHDGRNGRIFESGDTEALAKALADVTDEANYGSYRSAVADCLDTWRQKCDPVRGIRLSLERCGVLKRQGNMPEGFAAVGLKQTG